MFVQLLHLGVLFFHQGCLHGLNLVALASCSVLAAIFICLIQYLCTRVHNLNSAASTGSYPILTAAIFFTSWRCFYWSGLRTSTLSNLPALWRCPSESITSRIHNAYHPEYVLPDEQSYRHLTSNTRTNITAAGVLLLNWEIFRTGAHRSVTIKHPGTIRKAVCINSTGNTHRNH